MFSIIALIWNTKQSEPMLHGKNVKHPMLMWGFIDSDAANNPHSKNLMTKMCSIINLCL